MTAQAQRIHPEVKTNANRQPKRRAHARTRPMTKSRQQKIGQFLAAVGGALMPLASYCVAHIEAPEHQMMWIFVAFALLFSTPTLVQWAQKWCGHMVKAIGFAVLLEGVMVFSYLSALGVACMVILVSINAHAAWSLAKASKLDKGR